MTHDQFRDYLSEYLDGELTRNLRAEADAHLRGCEDCRVLFITTKKAIELSRGQGVPKLSREFRDQLKKKVQRAYQLGKRGEG